MYFLQVLEKKIRRQIRSILQKYSNENEEHLIIMSRQPYIGPNHDIDGLKNAVLSPKCKSIDGAVKEFFEALEEETVIFVYGWYSIKPESAKQIFDELEFQLSQHKHIFVEYLFESPE